MKRVGEHLGGQTVNFRIELQRSDGVRSTRHLEVHVAEGVFRTENVRERHVGILVVDQAHGDAGDWCLDRHARGHERKR